MKIGDYVRTKDGFIARIKEIEQNERLHLFLKAIYTDNYKIDMVLEDEIIKSSPSIIDLIEVGDYVNGECVINADSIEVYTRDGMYLNEDIKSIVTREIFESMEYKVGE